MLRKLNIIKSLAVLTGGFAALFSGAAVFAAPPEADYAQLCGRTEFKPRTIEYLTNRPAVRESRNSVSVLSDIVNDDASPPAMVEQALAQLERYARGKDDTGAKAHLALAKYHQNTNRSSEARAIVIGHLESALNLGETVETKLGDVYASSFGGRPDLEKARFYYGLAFAKGDVRAWLGLSDIQVEAGEEAEAKELLDRARSMAIEKAQDGKCNSLRYIAEAEAAWSVDDPNMQASSRAWFRAAAIGGDITAARHLWRWCEESPGDTEFCGERKAIDWLQLAAENGSVASMRAMGNELEKRTSPADRARSSFWYEQAIYHGDSLPLAALQAEYLQLGNDAELIKKGYVFLDLALENPVIEPDLLLDAGDAYFYGYDGKRDIEKALGYYREAARLQSDKAAYALGNYYYYYQPKSRKNLARAVRSYREASSYGSSAAMAKMTELSRCYEDTAYADIFGSPEVWENRAIATNTRAYKLEQARRFLSDGDRTRYRQILRELSFSGKAEAMLALIRDYRQGSDTDQVLAQIWDGKRGEDANQNAGFYLTSAEAYLDGDLLPFDPESANRMFEAAYQADPQKSYMDYAEYLLDAPEPYRDVDRALDMLGLAFRDGDPEAAMVLAEFHEANPDQEKPAGFDRQFDKITGGRSQFHLLFMEANRTEDPAALRNIARKIEDRFPCNARDSVKLAKFYLKKLDDKAAAANWVAHAEKFYEKQPKTLYDLSVLYKELGNSGLAAKYNAEAVLHGNDRAIDEQAAARFAAGRRDARTLSMIQSAASRRGLSAKSLPALIELTTAPEISAAERTRAGQVLAIVLEGASDPAFFADLSTTFMSMDGAAEKQKGQEYLKRAAELGDAEAMLLLSRHYATGYLVERSPVESFGWLKKAAEAGNREAMLKLAIMYRQGYGTAADPGEAEEWQKRARQGTN